MRQGNVADTTFRGPFSISVLQEMTV